MKINNVLFVDDEVQILNAIRRGLRKESYKMFFASSGSEALKIMEEESIHVVVTDMRMPKMTGLDLLTKVKDQYPDVVKLILSGYTQLQQIIVTINRIDIYRFITKPFDIDEDLKVAVQSAIDYYNTNIENNNLRRSIAKKNELYQNMLRKNNEKIRLMKQDLSFVETYNRTITNRYIQFGLLVANKKITNECYRDEIEYTSHLFDYTIRHMPSIYGEFNVRMIQSELTSFIEKHINKDDIKAEIQLTATMEVRDYRGEYKLFLFTMKTILEAYFDTRDNDVFSLAVREKGSDTSNEIELQWLLKSERNQITKDVMRIETIETFFRNLLEAYRGSLIFENRNGEHLVLMRIPVELSEQLEESHDKDSNY